MSAKSKHSRVKRNRGKKKSKFRPAGAAANPQQQEIAQDVVKSATPLNTAPVASAPLSKRAAASSALPLHYEFISSDLKRIGILTAIILALLVAAYYLFS